MTDDSRKIIIFCLSYSKCITTYG